MIKYCKKKKAKTKTNNTLFLKYTFLKSIWWKETLQYFHLGVAQRRKRAKSDFTRIFFQRFLVIENPFNIFILVYCNAAKRQKFTTSVLTAMNKMTKDKSTSTSLWMTEGWPKSIAQNYPSGNWESIWLRGRNLNHFVEISVWLRKGENEWMTSSVHILCVICLTLYAFAFFTRTWRTLNVDIRVFSNPCLS